MTNVRKREVDIQRARADSLSFFGSTRRAKSDVPCAGVTRQPARVTGVGQCAVTRCAGIPRWILCGWLLVLPSLTVAQQARDPANPQGKWEVLKKCRLITNAILDGDSFHVLHKGREYLFCLCFVDAPGAVPALGVRFRYQAAYFGHFRHEHSAGGLAAQFTREKLSQRGRGGWGCGTRTSSGRRP